MSTAPADDPMSNDEPPHSTQPHGRGEACVVVAADAESEQLQRGAESLHAHSPAGTTVLSVPASTAAVNRALAQLAPADVVVLSEPCRVTAGWLERLRSAALEDTNTATASALANTGTELALSDDEPEGRGEECGEDGLARLGDGLTSRTLRLRPRLNRAVGPCVYIRRDALELVGSLDPSLDLRWALEIDFAQRCLLTGLAHVAADDVVVQRLAGVAPREDAEPPAWLFERYPYLSEPLPLASSGVLAQALEAARGPRSPLWVTLDARALEGAVTGTQVHILELVRALATTGALRLRLLVREQKIDRPTLELLRGLPETELLAEDDVDETTPPSTVFHRPMQTFAPEDVQLALRLGERIVLSQLDLIAYRNPGYFSDAQAWAAYRRASRHGMSAAERVIVFSEHTRRELLCDALVEHERIRVIAPGLDHRSPAAPRRPAALDEDGHDASSDEALEGFLLCLGTDFRHKNRAFALRLLAALRDRHDWRGRLVLAGTHIPHGSSRELEQAVLDEHPALGESVIDLGPVDEGEKAWLMARAGAVVYPSVYEGFGLVPFEAALNGVPCVFAPQSSLAEAAPQGSATILPWDPVGSADAAYPLLTDPEARSRHIQALVEAAGRLTWQASAEAMVELYREAAAAPVRDAATLSRDLVAREHRLTAEHQVVVRRLIAEREHAQRMYDELNAEVGFGLSLIGPHGSLPDGLQRALLAISARPGLSRLVYGMPAGAFALARALSRLARRGPRDTA
jgi:glycosyltransferase involved in cell wall biosynthesis